MAEEKIIKNIEIDFEKFTLHFETLKEFDLIRLFRSAAIIYCFDFPHGQVTPDGKRFNYNYSTGIWDDYIDDYRINFSRFKYRKYLLGLSNQTCDCIKQKGHNKKMIRVKLDSSAMLSLLKTLKIELEKHLDSKTVENLNDNFLWNLVLAPTAEMAIELIRQGKYEFFNDMSDFY